MSEPAMDVTSQPIDLLSTRSRIEELRNVNERSELGPAEQKFLKNLADELESKINWAFLECPSDLNALHIDDLNQNLLQLKKELGELEAESAGVECEIEELQRRYYDKMESQLENLCCSLDITESQDFEKAEGNKDMEASYLMDDLEEHGSEFKLLELSHQIEEYKTTLKSLQDLDAIFNRFAAVEKIEDALTGIRVIEIDGNNICLSLETHFPFLESVLHQQRIESVIESTELNHELIVEIGDGTWELKNVEIFPNDVYIGEIINGAKSFRHDYPAFLIIENISSSERFVRRVQDKIALSTLRRFVVKNADNSRHSFEYQSRDETIVVHMVGGIDAFIKLPRGWPLSNLGLELMLLKSTSQFSKEISLTFFCKIVGMANSLNTNLRHCLPRFADSVEEILMQQMRSESTQMVTS